MILTKNSNGEWIQVAGNGKAEYGASTERKGDIVVPATTAGNFQTVNVVFAQAMPDNDYTVVIDEGGNTWAHCTTNVTNKATTGFTLFFLNVAGADAPQMTFKYRAFKLYTDTEYNSLLEDVAKLSGVTNGTGMRNTAYVNSDGFIANWYKVGRICTVDIQYTLSQFTVSDIEIITGLPKPIVQIACVGEGGENTNVSDFVIKRNGAVRTHYSGAEGQFMHGTATYITAE